MGSGSWSSDAFKSVSSARATSSVKEVFTRASMDPTMDPTKMVVRESRDSAEHPNSTAIVVAFDVTGSMGMIPHHFAKEALGTLMRELLEKQPAPDPQLLVAAVGDSTCDQYPLQVGQFESDIRVDDWLTKIHIEQGGGGGNHESYGLAYQFAGNHTSIDCFEKRGLKGFLFVIGDEAGHECTSARELARVFGTTPQDDISLDEQIKLAQRMYEVFHIVVKSNSYTTGANAPYWRKKLGQNVLVLEDYKALPEMILTAIATTAGMDYDKATAGFSKETSALVLASGVRDLPMRGGGTTGEIARL